MNIVRPVTDDGLVGFDEHGRFIHCEVDDDHRIFTLVKDVRRSTCVICGRGWEATSASIGDQTSWLVSNSTVHRSCLIRHEGLREMEEVRRAVVDARIHFHKLVLLPNNYWPKTDPWSAKPWYEIELADHPAKLVVGSRKRVMSIEVYPQGGTKLEWA